jgi:hypothetical protein
MCVAFMLEHYLWLLEFKFNLDPILFYPIWKKCKIVFFCASSLSHFLGPSSCAAQLGKVRCRPSFSPAWFASVAIRQPSSAQGPQRQPSSGPTQLRPVPLSRGRRQVGATCHPPPSVAPSQNPTRARARACAWCFWPWARTPRPPSAYLAPSTPVRLAFSPETLVPKPSCAAPSRTLVRRRRRRSPAPPPLRRREASREQRKKVRNPPVLFVRVLTLVTTRSCSPELAPPRPSAPSCRASSSSPDRSYRCPRSIMRVARFTSVVSVLQNVPRSSNPSELAGASPAATAHRCQRRRSSCPGRPQPSDLEPMAQIKSNPSQLVSVPVNTTMHRPFAKETLIFLCFTLMPSLSSKVISVRPFSLCFKP